MGMFKSIWMILTGIDREIRKIHDELDQVLNIVEKMNKDISIIETLQELQGSVILQIHTIVQQIQADLTPPAAVRLVIKIVGTTQGDNSMLQISDTGSAVATLEADDALGNAGAKLDAAPVWSVSDPALADLNVAEDGMTAVAKMKGPLGTFKLHVEGLSAGAPLSADSEDIKVVVGAAALLKLSVAGPAAPSA